MMYRQGVLAIFVIAAGLSSGGCVSADQHRSALADLQRLRVEAWQRSVEAAALRLALDRAAAENAQLRAYGAQASSDAVNALAARVDEVSRKQDALTEAVKAQPVCTPAGMLPADAAASQPKSRKVTDLLYSRF
ncbi:MAG: hypothetical protein IPK82_39905 [Polyangiaceae bacterium]|nr:hypothetical protein [Polyangiaceae bacterium]